MSANVTSVTDHRIGKFYVNVHVAGDCKTFDSMMKANEYMDSVKERYDLDSILVTLRELVLTARKEFRYESAYAF